MKLIKAKYKDDAPSYLAANAWCDGYGKGSKAQLDYDIEQIKAKREEIAELEHKQWIEWSKAVGGEVSILRRARWGRLWIPYAELTEEQKDQDRQYGDKIISLCVEVK